MHQISPKQQTGVSLKGHHIVKKIDFRVLTKFGII